MKITTISLTKTIAMPGYNNDKPAVIEAILDEGDTMEECLSELNKRLTAWHQKEYPWLYNTPSSISSIDAAIAPYTNAGASPSIGGPFTLPTIDKSIERLEIAIDNLTWDEINSEMEDNARNAGLTIQYFKKAILLCPSLDALSLFKRYANIDKSLQEAYMNKLKELTNGNK